MFPTTDHYIAAELASIRAVRERHEPAPKPRPKPRPKPKPQPVEAWRPLVSKHFRAADVDRALCLIWYESRGDPDAYNPSGARGLFQVKGWWAESFGMAPDDLFDPANNVYAASQIRDIQGWTAWSPFNRGLCRG